MKVSDVLRMLHDDGRYLHPLVEATICAFNIGFYAADGATPLLTVSPDGEAGQITLNPDGTTGVSTFAGSDLSITPVAAVPVPATIWLLISGLAAIGLSICHRHNVSSM